MRLIRLKRVAKEVRENSIYDRKICVRYIGLEHIESETGRLTIGKTAEPAGLVARFRAGDVLFGKLRPYLAKVALPCFDGTCSTEAIVLRTIPSYDARFLRYVLLSKPFLDEVSLSTYGVKMPRTSWEFIGNLFVPNLPLSEQQRIADFLDRETVRIDTLIEKKERVAQLLQERRESFISRVVLEGLTSNAPLQETGSPYVPKIPAHWSLVRLKQIARVRGGIALGRALPQGARTVQVAYLRVANVQAGWLDLSDVAEMTVTEEELERFRLRPGDVLMLEGGDNDKLGRGTVWNGEIEPCVHQNHVFVVQPHDESLAEWISLCSNARYGRDFFFLNARQSTNLASVSKSRLEQFPVPLPPTAERIALVEKVMTHQSSIDIAVRKIRKSVDKLRELRSALIAGAVTGQIDVRRWRRLMETKQRIDQLESEATGA